MGFEDLNRPILEGLEDCVRPPQVVDGIYCNGIYLYITYITHTYIQITFNIVYNMIK